MNLRRAMALAAALHGLASSVAAAEPGDPLQSARWEDMRREFFAGQAVVVDDRVKVTAPQTAENALNVPVTVDATALAPVGEVVVFADFNPIVRVLRYLPAKARPYLGFRMKLQQSSPVRAAALTADGTWHVGGAWVNTAGGGCTLPSTGSAAADWQRHLNELSGRFWTPASGEGSRLRFRIVHPMDTGLSPGIPAFFLQEITLADPSGAILMRIEPYEPVSENPVFTLHVEDRAMASIRISGRDNNGNLLSTSVEK